MSVYNQFNNYESTSDLSESRSVESVAYSVNDTPDGGSKIQVGEDTSKNDPITKENRVSPREQNEVFLHACSFFEYSAAEHELEDEFAFDDPSDSPPPGCNLKFLQWKIRRFVEHFIVRIFTSVLIIVDMVVLIMDLVNSSNKPHNPLEYCSLALSLYFMLEVGLRMFGLGVRHYFSKWYNSLDFAIVTFTLILSILMVVLEDMTSSPANLLVLLRLIRLLRISRLLWQRRHLQTGVRQFISQNKRRYQDDGFDLDLTYIAPRIIAMSFPSSGKMSIYRNDIREVARFFNVKHKDRYRIYNLCSERHYDTSYFADNVQRYFIDDHNVPSLREMLDFSENVEAWLSRHEENVIAVHCKGGKGRTGTLICVVLIDTGVFKDAERCLGYFGDRRTDKNVGSKFQGVETPSQSRYVGYYEEVVRNGRVLPHEVPLLLTGFILSGIRSIGNGDGSDFKVSVKSRCHPVEHLFSLEGDINSKVIRRLNKDEISVQFCHPPVVTGDTKVMFHSQNRKIPRGYDNCPFYFWFHTSFIKNNELTLSRQELDNPHKPKTWSTYRDNFLLTVRFSQVK